MAKSYRPERKSVATLLPSGPNKMSPISSDPTSACKPSIRSSFSDDEDMFELIEMFVEDAPDKIQRLQYAIDTQDIEAVRVFAHQLKGSAASYGFEALTDLARQLEANAIREDFPDVLECGQCVIGFLSSIRV